MIHLIKRWRWKRFLKSDELRETVQKEFENGNIVADENGIYFPKLGAGLASAHFGMPAMEDMTVQNITADSVEAGNLTISGYRWEKSENGLTNLVREGDADGET